LTEKKGIPLSVVISPANTHDIKLVIDVVDNTVIKRPKSLSISKSISKSRRQRRRLMQHLCLDKGYKSIEEEQELIKRGYILHMPIKKKKKKKKGEDSKEIAIPNRKKYSPKRWVVERTNSCITDLENCLQGMKRRTETILGWYSSLVVLLSIES
jgi:hypothetical protein